MAEASERLISGATTVAVAGAGMALMERASKVGAKRSRPSKGTSGFSGISKKEFLDAWWEVSPQTYNTVHRRVGGIGQTMISHLLWTSEASITRRELVDRILNRAYRKFDRDKG